MKVTIENNEITIRVPLSANPQPSSTGKSLMLYTSSGIIKTETLFKDRPVSVGLNVMISVRKPQPQLGSDL
jgi:hypothetical protein